MINKVVIYGERCSGTNYLQVIIKKNFNTKICWDYGWKHFFGFQEEKLKKSDDVLFICIVRDIKKWLNSFYREKHHLPIKYKLLPKEKSIQAFLNDEFYSVLNYKTDNKELMEDRNIYTGKRYKNIFELRHTKLKYMIDDLPNKVKNYILIRHEDLLNNFEETLIKIKNKGLTVRKNISFPLNTEDYKGRTNVIVKKKKDKIIDSQIINNPNLITYYEKKLGYL